MKILVIPGSLRKESFNKSVARHLVNIKPAEVEMQIFELNDLPMFNEDLESELPESVKLLLEKAEWADALIVASPEYNNSLPAPTRNMFHWLSRKYSNHLIDNKPLGIVGVSDGGFGTVRAQKELMFLGVLLRMKVHVDHKLPISKAYEVFNDQGEIVDKNIREKLTKFLHNFIVWVRKES